MKRRKPKSKGEKEIYTHLNAEFHRIARRDKKAFLSEQCKEREENNRMGKTRDLFKKIRDTKGTFHAKMGLIKDRNGRDLTEAEDIKKKWQEYTEELNKKDLHDPDNHDGVMTHLEPDILECEAKWGLRKHQYARYWMLGAGALGRPRGMVWGGRWEEGSGWGTHVYLWQIHFDVWQN